MWKHGPASLGFMCLQLLGMTLDTKTTSLRWRAFADLLIVVGVLVGVKQLLLPVTMLFAGPASTFSAMIVATWLLRRSRSSWSELGLQMPENWLRTIWHTALVFVALLAAAGSFQALANLFFEDIGTSGRFDFVEGNLPGYLMMLALVWTHGSFFEELLFRAFIITKLDLGLGQTRFSGYLAVLLAAVFFGYRHYYYQGLHGAVVTGGIGLVFGLIYLKAGKKSILPLALAHGAMNSTAQTIRFLGG